MERVERVERVMNDKAQISERSQAADNEHQKETDFGYRKVSTKAKAGLVADVFHSVANRYDVMNDLMSGGVHRIWKALTIESSGVRAGHKVLDIAGGTGDLADKFAKKVGTSGQVVLADINESMLQVGRARLTDRGHAGNIDYCLADAEKLPFASDYFDCISIAFGLRNVTNKQSALESMLRALKPGGRLLVLEFSKPIYPWLEKLYDEYSFRLIPLIGQMVANDRESYQYLAESIRMHPDQETLADMMRVAGFSKVRYHNMTGGVVALHVGYKT